MSVLVKSDIAPLGELIQIPNSYTSKHKWDVLHNGALFGIICGTTGTGKTTDLLGLIPCLTDDLKHIIIATQKPTDIAHQQIEKYCKEKSIQYHYLHDPEELMTLLSDLVEKKKEKEHILVIFDDFQTKYNGAENDENNIMIRCFSVLRSFNCSCIIITQNYTSVPTKIRNNSTIRIIHQMADEHGIDAMIRDVSGLLYNGSVDRKVLNQKVKQLYNQVWLNPYEFLFVLSRPYRELRLGWKNVILSTRPKDVKRGGGGDVLKKRHQLFNQAVALGLPKNMRNLSSNVIQKFVDKMSAKAQKDIGNTAEEINKVIADIPEDFDEKKVVSKLNRMILRFHKSENPKYLDKIASLCDELVKNGTFSEDDMLYKLKQSNLDELINI